jgi:hypothetical protein
MLRPRRGATPALPGLSSTGSSDEELGVDDDIAPTPTPEPTRTAAAPTVEGNEG